MRRYLFLLAAALALSMGTLSAGHLWVNGAREKMDIQETVQMGDPAAAAGLSVACRTWDRDGHLLWDTTFTPGRTEGAETVFRLSVEEESEPLQWSDSVSLLQAGDDFSVIDIINMPSMGVHRQELLLRPLQDVAARTAAGETRTETVRLSDYYGHYPFVLDSNSGEYPNSSFSVSSEEYTWLGEYIHVKVDETMVREVTVEKNGAGQVLSAAMSRREGDSAGELRSSGVITKQGIFLVAESVDSSGKPDGRLECRDGPGVHLIPSRSDNHVELLSPRLFYPTGDAHALLLAATPDESELLLYACEDGKLVLTVLDPATGAVLQRLDLLEQLAENSRLHLIEGDGLYLAVSSSDVFSLVRREDGGYRQVLTGALELEDGEQDLCRVGPTLVWDGRRMALASIVSSNGSFCCFNSAVHVAVWDEGGLCLHGRYRCGLGHDPATGVYRYFRAPLSLVFGGNNPMDFLQR